MARAKRWSATACDDRLKLAGYEPLRFTRRRIISEPGGVIRTVSELLARRATAGGAR